MKRSSLLLLLLSVLPALRLAASPVLADEFIFTAAPFAQCHASTIEETAEGMVAAWFGGSREGNPDVSIWVARQTGGVWSAPEEVANGLQYTLTDGTTFRYACWNPVLFQPRDGPLMLFYKVGPSFRDWWGMLITSADGGRTWSEPRRLPRGMYGPIKNKPVQLANGSILCPVSDESHESPGAWRVHFEMTSDGGRTWARTRPLNDGFELEAIQPSLLDHGAGRWQAVGRTKQGRLFQIWSEDDGLSWGEMTLTTLPIPNSGTDAVTLADGRHALVYNHTLQGRSPLNLAISSDGKNWEAAHVFETEPGEYSYPAIIQTSDGKLHITYTWKRERIKHVVLDPAQLTTTPIRNGVWPAAQ